MDNEEKELTELIKRLENDNEEKLTNNDKEYQEEIQKLERQKVEVAKQITRLSIIRRCCWIVCLILLLILPHKLFVIMSIVMLAICVSVLPTNAKQSYANIEQTISKKKYAYEHSPEKEKARREKELQEQIDQATPFKSIEEKGDYHILAIAWDLSYKGKLRSVTVLLKSSQPNIKNLHFKYEGEGKTVEVSSVGTEEVFLNIVRKKIYNNVKDGNYEIADGLFRAVFEKDPYTGEDVDRNDYIYNDTDDEIEDEE